jgi:HPt (histidine-containing phosphotransfer) domain-containing protein
METNESSLVNLELLNETADLGLDDLCDLLEIYLEQATETMEDLQTAIHRKRATEVRELAHRLAGSSAACGASGVMNSLRQLEQCGKSNDLTQAESLMQQITEQMKETESCFRDFVQPKGGAFRATFVPPKQKPI